MSYHPTPTPTIYCADHDQIIVTAPSDENYLSGVYTVAHKSSVGVKYVNTENNIKITYSTRVNNIVGGHWRWANNVSPYTLYYANPSTDACIPKTGWVDISQNTFTGNISNDENVVYDVYQPCKVYDVYRKCESYDVYQKCISVPEITPTVTVELPVQTPIPTPSATPVQSPMYVTIPEAPAGIIRNEQTELTWVKAVPTITYASRGKLNRQYTPKKIKLFGLSMSNTDRIYMTGDQSIFSQDLQLIDMFSHIPSLSADFPGFYGVPVDYIVKNDNIIEVFINGVTSPGELDIIIMNRAGYSGLSPTYNATQWTDYNLQNRLINVV